MSGAYPPAIRSLLKGVPCIVMCMTAGTVFWVMNYAVIKHPHDHAPKFSFTSTKMELIIRRRDDYNREVYQAMLNYDPNLKASHANVATLNR